VIAVTGVALRNDRCAGSPGSRVEGLRGPWCQVFDAGARQSAGRIGFDESADASAQKGAPAP